MWPSRHLRFLRMYFLSIGTRATLLRYAGRSAAQDGFRTYSNKQDRYHIEYPAAWKETSKSGASILLQDPDRKSSTVGVTVTPVRIATLEEIGDASAVADKLIAAEKAKVSVCSSLRFVLQISLMTLRQFKTHRLP